MQTIIRIRVRKDFERTIPRSTLPNRVFAVFETQNDRALGIYLDWFPHEHASSPIPYFTSDNGETFRHVSSFLTVADDGGMDMQIGEEETKPETVTALRELLDAWRKDFEKESRQAGQVKWYLGQ
jgi:hypothetical protein